MENSSYVKIKCIGTKYKKYREAKMLRQLDVAIALDCTYEYICRVEKGQKYLSLRKLFELADILEVEIKDLMNFK